MSSFCSSGAPIAPPSSGRLLVRGWCPELHLVVPDLTMFFVFEEELWRERKEGEKKGWVRRPTSDFQQRRRLSPVAEASSRCQKPFHDVRMFRGASMNENRLIEVQGVFWRGFEAFRPPSMASEVYEVRHAFWEV
uniref:uncharacterized protein LOC101311764 isoform X2 n=1 Tax=Fragaria vesca subsp. vesca TaxID=101020 RepID=UPI0005CADDA3|nr:PREDICTED: uncharacterized protein LOC101311764 isoform X2 [Fragaria vesca subsp. vesca]